MLSYFGIVASGSMFDLPNAALGLVYYSIWLSVMPVFPKELKLFISSLAMLSSIFLAVKLLILSEMCVLCWSTHVINARLWWNAYSSFTLGNSKLEATVDNGKAKIKRV